MGNNGVKLGRQLDRTLDAFRNTAIVAQFSFIIVTDFTEEIHRYAFRASLGWIEEILHHVNVCFILLAANVAAPWDAHLPATPPPRFPALFLAKHVAQVVAIGILCFLAVVVYLGALKNIPSDW